MLCQDFLAEGGFTAEAMPALNECLALAADARRLMAGEPIVPEPAVAEPVPATAPLDQVAGSIARILGDTGRSLTSPVAAE